MPRIIRPYLRMSSRLENLPCELLQRVALECAGSSTSTNPLVDVANLMLVSRTMYATMSFRQHPHLYGRIFRTQFNVEAPLRRHKSITDYALSYELFQRVSTLQHVRDLEFSPEYVCQDLWTIHNMLMESEGLNHVQLYEAGIREYLVQLLQSRVGPDGWPLNDAVDSFACCCLNLTVTQGAVVDPKYKRRVIEAIRPFTLNVLRTSVACQTMTCQVKMYGRRVIVHPPRTASTAIRLLMSLVEEQPLRRPLEPRDDEHDPLLLRLISNHMPDSQLGKGRSIVFDSAYDSFLGAETCFESSMSYLQRHKLAGYYKGTYLVAPFLLTDTGCKTSITPASDFVARAPFDCLLEPSDPSEHIDDVSSYGTNSGKFSGVVGDVQWEGLISDKGLVTLRRRSLSDPFEVWLFEGYMYNNGILLGRWTSGLSFSSVGNCLSGIFILHKEP